MQAGEKIQQDRNMLEEVKCVLLSRFFFLTVLYTGLHSAYGERRSLQNLILTPKRKETLRYGIEVAQK